MPEQHDLPESIAWRVTGKLESGVAGFIGVVRSAISRLWNRFHRDS